LAELEGVHRPATKTKTFKAKTKKNQRIVCEQIEKPVFSGAKT
jgi:hypothetical protein